MTNFRPDITVMVDWALKNQLSIYHDHLSKVAWYNWDDCRSHRWGGYRNNGHRRDGCRSHKEGDRSRRQGQGPQEESEHTAHYSAVTVWSSFLQPQHYHMLWHQTDKQHRSRRAYGCTTRLVQCTGRGAVIGCLLAFSLFGFVLEQCRLVAPKRKTGKGVFCTLKQLVTPRRRVYFWQVARSTRRE